MIIPAMPRVAHPAACRSWNALPFMITLFRAAAHRVIGGSSSIGLVKRIWVMGRSIGSAMA